MRVLALSLLALMGAQSASLAATLNPKDIATLESAGPMSSIAAGAFEKTLWRDNKRSEIVELIKNLPPESPTRSIHDLKRRVLLSQADATLINNDVDPTTEDNLFILRIKKLQEMGLFEDALKLYTDNINTPRDPRLAETGLILITHQRGLATACLEEKVLAPQFPEDAFFDVMDNICSYALGQTDEPPEVESIILKAVFKEETYKINAADIEILTRLSPLELAVLKSEQRIDYTAFDTTPAALRPYPSSVLMTFLEDKGLPGERLLPLQTEMTRRGYVSVRRLPAWKEAHILTVDIEDKRRNNDAAGAQIQFWNNFTPILKREHELVTLAPYGTTLASMEPRISGINFYKAVAVILASGNNLSREWCEKTLAQPAPYGPLYYETLILLRNCERNPDKTVDNLETSLKNIDIRKHTELFIIMGLLAQGSPDHTAIREVYEKELPLTAAYDYVMHTQQQDLKRPENKASEGFGVPLLGVLSAVKGKTGENLNPAVLQITVKSLLDEGLDADARQLARDVLVGILQKTKMKDGE